MKKVLWAMIGVFIMLAPLGGIWTLLFQPIFGGGGLDLSPIYPIYGGMIILAGIMVGGFVILHDEILKLRDEIKNQNINSTKENMPPSNSEKHIEND